LAGFRKLDPIPNIEAEAHFLEATEQLFFKGKNYEECRYQILFYRPHK
jgi:hypothetical protein